MGLHFLRGGAGSERCGSEEGPSTGWGATAVTGGTCDSGTTAEGVGAGASGATPASTGFSEACAFGCHFFRSGTGTLDGASVATATGATAAGTAGEGFISGDFASALFGCHFFRSGADMSVLTIGAVAIASAVIGAVVMGSVGAGAITPGELTGAATGDESGPAEGAGTGFSPAVGTAALGCHFFRSAGGTAAPAATEGGAATVASIVEAVAGT